jgi:CCR4-NOT transcription complex subunit 1
MCLGRLDDDFDSHISKIGEQISLSDIISELGCGCTCNTTHCKEMLSLLEPLDDMGISKLLGAVVCTRIGVGEAQNTYSIFLLTFGNNQTIDSSQLTSWNIDVLVDSINEIVRLHYLCFCCLFIFFSISLFYSTCKMQAPGTNWTHVIENLDHEGFIIPDEAAFRLLMSICYRACKVCTIISCSGY